MKVELIVDTMDFTKPGEVWITCMCGQGVLRVGDELTALRMWYPPPRQQPGGDADSADDYAAIGAIAARVVKIEAYGHTLDELPSGMSARVVLSVSRKGVAVWSD